MVSLPGFQIQCDGVEQRGIGDAPAPGDVPFATILEVGSHGPQRSPSGSGKASRPGAERSRSRSTATGREAVRSGPVSASVVAALDTDCGASVVQS